ncbi:uncharacterized protein BCR38DRAFT_445402 [Pseudomassariella vexata]|uniref:Zn(2)-C6 fungal-type domain-containing protein n=1 Tax=Pseudomassariella vexata TaxID=1141098 RepID=A0A1Y2DKI7_9PEZI|nr:uncharacterized protein BCR38DRAFT_445402 [Pseudomassariella vexata]ORY59753.1 hypothetical protein BCR38DRAFT_445402 [Pseudomassariella vexata]
MTTSHEDNRADSSSPVSGADGLQVAYRPLSNSGKPAAQRMKRTQVSRACARCRRLQKGCSEVRPCQRCVKTGLAEQCLASGIAPPLQPPAREHQQHYDAYMIGTPGSITSPSLSSLDLPITPQAFTSFARESFQRQIDLLPAAVIDHCTERFFARLRPTIPILTPEYVATLRRSVAEASEASNEAYCVLLGMCTMVLLQVEPPESRPVGSGDRIVAKTNAKYGWILLDEALAAHRHLSRQSNPIFEHVLFNFFLYACHAALFHHSQAFFFLRETTTLCMLLKIEMLPDLTRVLAERLFWVLVASERSHAIRYKRPITLQITASSPSFMPSSTSPVNSALETSELAGFWCLAALFQPLDTSFIAILNAETLSCPPSSSALDGIESSVNAALHYSPSPPSTLHQTQKANLRVTQLWLRIILWQVRLRLGQLFEAPPGSAASSHTYHYPLVVAKDLAMSTRDLELASMNVHGVGLTEKLFDIACVVINVLARVPVGIMRAAAEEDVRYLRGLIRELPGGKTVYERLLVKHLVAVLPGMVRG